MNFRIVLLYYSLWRTEEVAQSHGMKSFEAVIRGVCKLNCFTAKAEITVSTPLMCSRSCSTDSVSRSTMRFSTPRFLRASTSGFDAEAGHMLVIAC